MFEYVKKHLSKKEFVSIFQSFIAVASLDCIIEWQQVLAGDLSKPAFFALGGALLRSFFKAIWIYVKNSNNAEKVSA